jgi:hypothetical protein
MFEHLSVGKFIFSIRALSDLNLPAYKGSTLRGGFGQALKRVTCALRNQDCRQCLLRERCVYLYLFETPPPADAAMMRLYPSAPHPFVIEPPASTQRLVAAGQSLDFGLVLVGRALDYLPYFVYAFVCLGEMGLGRQRGRFSLEEVKSANGNGWVSVYDQEQKTLQRFSAYPSGEAIENRCRELAGRQQLTLGFLTPTRIKSAEHLVDQPEFHHLVRALLRRLSSLSYFHCGHKPDLDFRGLAEHAQKIERVSADLRWHDWERYSSRQKQSMLLGGFLGTATFAGDFDEFLPLLAWGEVLHLGKAVSFGLGRYEIHSLAQ